MMKYIKNIYKRLKCKHEYELTSTRLINGGMQKMWRYKCKKCGKERCEF